MRVRTILERELEKRRASQGRMAVEGLGNEGDRLNIGGLECNAPAGSAFKFSEWEGGEVEFITSFVSPGEKGGDGLSDFLESLEDH
jgi:signal recognition particle receptor subunit beta